MKTKSELTEKVKKLLAMARCKNANPNEAATALRQAQTLMRQHNITDVDVDAVDVSEATSNCRAKKFYPLWLSALASSIATGFGTKAFFSGDTIFFIGCGNSPELAKYAFDVLHRQCKKARKLYMSSKKSDINAANAYCEGWVYSATKLISSILTEEHETKISAYLEKTYDIKTTKPAITRGGKLDVDDDALIAFMMGKEAGRNAELNRGVYSTKVSQIEGLRNAN